MIARAITMLLLASAFPAFTQAPPPQSATQTRSSDIGFSYTIPSDWQVLDVAPTLSSVQGQATKGAKSEEEKKGIACIQIAMTARHGDPASVVVVVALPFDCFGQDLAEKELPGFATGASEGLKSTFDLSNPEYGSYSLGAHSLWIERAAGTVKEHPEMKYTVETVCTLLKKGAACWMTMAADDTGLQTFEHGSVVLDGEAPEMLVPADAFVKKPS